MREEAYIISDGHGQTYKVPKKPVSSICLNQPDSVPDLFTGVWRKRMRWGSAFGGKKISDQSSFRFINRLIDSSYTLNMRF